MKLYSEKYFFSLQILGVERHKHSIYPNGSAAREVLPSYKIFHKRGEVYRPASGFMKPCRNGVINKKEAVRMLFLEYLQCSACQKAKKWLDEHQISCEDRHIMENNPTSDQMRIGA